LFSSADVCERTYSSPFREERAVLKSSDKVVFYPLSVYMIDSASASL